MNKDELKRKIIFTWDDNSCRHYRYIAPLFEKYGLRCTFYINPGWTSFEKKFLKGYTMLNKAGFEIGSHGFTHKNMTKLSSEDYLIQLVKSKQLIQQWFNQPIQTFAFPHHEYTMDMLQLAKKYFIETRNTLQNSVRYSLKSNTSILQIKEIDIITKLHNKNLIFSGHSVALNTFEIGNPCKAAGYEPILIETLEKILQTLLISNSEDDFCSLLDVSI